MKKKITLILIIIFLSFANIIKSQDKDTFTLWLGASWNPVSVSNLPLYLREVPYYKGTGGMLDKSSYHISLYIPFDFRFLISNNNFGINYGIGAEITASNAKIFIDNRYMYGGTALFGGIIMLGPISSAGVKPIIPGLTLSPNAFMEIPISYKNAKRSCNLHVSVGYQALAMVNGWETTYSNGWHDPISSDTDVHINQPLAVSS